MSTSLFDQPTAEKPVSTDTALVEHKATTPMEMIALAIERDLDPDRMRALLDLQREWQRDRAAEAFGEAVTDFQSRCPIVQKVRRAEARGNFAGYSFAGFDDIMRQVSPLLKECGLAISFATEQVNGQLKITCRVRHGIHYEDHALTVPVPSDLRVSETQKMGAALSYAKRYALCAALNIVVSDEDNDAGRLSENVDQEQLATIDEWFSVLEPAGFKRKPFMKWLGVERMSELPKDDYPKAIAELQAKARELGISQ